MDIVTTTPCPMHLAKLTAKVANATATMLAGNTTMDHSGHNMSNMGHSGHVMGNEHGMVVSWKFILKRNIRTLRSEKRINL